MDHLVLVLSFTASLCVIWLTFSLFFFLKSFWHLMEPYCSVPVFFPSVPFKAKYKKQKKCYPLSTHGNLGIIFSHLFALFFVCVFLFSSISLWIDVRLKGYALEEICT